MHNSGKAYYPSKPGHPGTSKKKGLRSRPALPARKYRRFNTFLSEHLGTITPGDSVA